MAGRCSQYRQTCGDTLRANSPEATAKLIAASGIEGLSGPVALRQYGLQFFVHCHNGAFSGCPVYAGISY